MADTVLIASCVKVLVKAVAEQKVMRHFVGQHQTFVASVGVMTVFLPWRKMADACISVM
jgi:hypothetical protein